MLKILNKFLILLVLSATGLAAAGENCRQCHVSKPRGKMPLHKPFSAAERAIGLQDKGQLTNYIGNYGNLAHYLEYLNDALHWPKSADDVRQYSFGLGLVVAVKGNVITSVLGAFADKIDWEPRDGSRGQLYSGEVTAPPPDLTPFQAMSDNPETWPRGYFDDAGTWISTPNERHWPGHFRRDVDPNSLTYGQEIPGEFVSDRDIYCVFTDEANHHPDGPVGIEVEQTAYSYGRPYAEDLLFFNFSIHNTSGRQLDSVYVGYYAVFRPDFDFLDDIHVADANPDDEHEFGNFVYVWDINNARDGAWENDPAELGMIGLGVLETPRKMGVTDFHFFNREVAPKTDEKMWAVISSNRQSSEIDLPQAFFHGANRRFDTTHPDSVRKYFPDGAPINFYVMTGPLTLAPGESVESSIATVLGSAASVPFKPDTTDLMNNFRTAQKMYARKYQGSGPPKTPVVQAVAGNRQVKLAWDAAAEKSIDPLTGKLDFEGYKIYRSTDAGKTWGTPITDQFGTVVGFQPIKIFDKINGIQGRDPAFNQSLGNDSGIQHRFVDENLLNGVEYWYCVTAFDRGNQQPDSLEQSYQSPLGSSTLESHTVVIIPGVRPQNYAPPEVNVPVDAISPIGGLCQGIVRLEIINPDAITGDDYTITFSDSALEVAGTDTNYVQGFNLVRRSKATGETTLLKNHLFSDETGDNLPVIDGFRLTLQNSPSGIEFIGWTKVNGDTCTFDWRTTPAEKYLTDQMVVKENIYTTDDFKIVIDTTESGGSQVNWYDFFAGADQDTSLHLPFKAYQISDPENPVDISQNTWLYEFSVNAPEQYRNQYFSPIGWDLVPGGAAFVTGSPGWYEKFPDILVLEDVQIDPAREDTTYSGLWLQTNHFPDKYVNAYGETVERETHAPSHGDEFSIRTYKPFRPEIRYEFSTRAAQFTQGKVIDLDKIRVVPDPYIVSNSWETSQFGKKLMFTNLPNTCKILIYTVAGDQVATIQHQNNQGFEFWNMRTSNDQFIAFGLYVYVVILPDGQKKVGRFLVIK
jgi:hypothetical protein